MSRDEDDKFDREVCSCFLGATFMFLLTYFSIYRTIRFFE